MITLRDVTLRRGTKVLLDKVSLTLNPGEKVGLVGRNGAGKSTLFALFDGSLHEDGGEYARPANWQMAQVAQHMPETAEPATDFVVAGDTRLMAVVPADLDLVLDQSLAQDAQQEIMHAHIVVRGHQLAHGMAQHVAALEAQAPCRLFVAVLDQEVAHHPMLAVQRAHHVQRIDRAFDRLPERFLDGALPCTVAMTPPLQ